MLKLFDKLVVNFFGKTLLKEEGILVSKGLRKTFFVQMVSSVLVFVSSLLLVRLATVQEYGIYIHVFNWISILVVIACFGMDDIVLVEIPLLLKRNKQQNISGLLWQVNRLFLSMSVAVSVIFLIIVFFGLIPGLQEHKFLFLTAVINIFLTGFIILNQNALQAFNRFYASQLGDKIVKPFLMIAVLSVLYLLKKNVDAAVLIFCNTFSVTISGILVFVFLRYTVRDNKSRVHHIIGDDKQTIKKAGYFLTISLLVLLKTRIGMLLLGSLNNTGEVGVFNITSRLADFVFLPYILIHSVVPQLFASHSDRHVLYKKRVFNKITQLVTISSSFIMIILAIFGKNILEWYDVSLVKYYDIMLILCASQLLYSLFGPASAILMMQGKQKMAAIALAIDIIFSSIIFFVFINWFGLQGAAWATFCGSLIYNVILRRLVRVHLTMPIDLETPK